MILAAKLCHSNNIVRSNYTTPTVSKTKLGPYLFLYDLGVGYRTVMA
jgi:hypothetical protein